MLKGLSKVFRITGLEIAEFTSKHCPFYLSYNSKNFP